ncbi:MAG: O-antigen ligase family protein [Candidatus Riflebacteria bacterium]|nr:O-antigen ligase family protein [Candidatus Riflebacteria bacterium]
MVNSKTGKLLWNTSIILFLFVWFWSFEVGDSRTLFALPILDFFAVLITSFLASRRGASFFDSLLICTISRKLNIEAMSRLESLSEMIPILWVIWLGLWSFTENEKIRSLLVLYHFGLSFDAGNSRSIGVGMAPGWECWNLNILLLFASQRAIFNREFSFKNNFAIVILFCSLFLIALHGFGSNSYFTSAMISTLVAFSLFAMIYFPGGFEEEGTVASIAVGGIAICLSAIYSGIADAGSLAILFRKRIFAGGLHPNVLGVWSMAILLCLSTRDCFGLFSHHLKRILNAFCILILVLTLIGSGSRVIWMIAILGILLSYSGIKKSVGMKKMFVGFAFLILVGIWKFGLETFGYEIFHNERFFIWKAAFENILNSPLVGYGCLSFGFGPQRIDEIAAQFTQDWNYPHSHNLYLEILLTGGVVLFMGFFCLCREWYKSSGNSMNSGLRNAVVCLLVAGIFDFPFFCPSVVFISLLLLFSGVYNGKKISIYRVLLHNENSSTSSHAVSPEILSPLPLPKEASLKVFQRKYVLQSLSGNQMKLGFLFFLFQLAIFLQIIPAISTRWFEKSVESLQNSNLEWQETMSRAVLLSPKRVELALQKMLWELSTGVGFQIQGFEKQVHELKKTWKDYYLLDFLAGRICYLRGNFKGAEDFFTRSLECEPRDMKGIRWAFLSLCLIKQQKAFYETSSRAIRRSEWGSSILLDHPSLGKSFFQNAIEGCLSEKNWYKFSSVARQLTERGALVVDEKTESSLLKQFGEEIAGELDLFKSLQNYYHGEYLKIIEKYGKVVDSLDLRGLHLMEMAAEKTNDYETFERVSRLVDEKWIYRSKASEDVISEYLKILLFLRKGNLAEAEEILSKQLAVDPANPWLLELMGDVFSSSARPEMALDVWQYSLKNVKSARLDPFFADGPRTILGPVGDQWVILFERAFRRLDTEAGEYNQQKWQTFQQRISEKIRNVKKQ